MKGTQTAKIMLKGISTLIFAIIMAILCIGSAFAKGADDYCIGDEYLFGHYEQDNDSRTDPKKEDISWIVIDKDEDKLLLLSKYGLDNTPYQSNGVGTTWASCKLREWLNGVFLKSAFTSSEIDMIAETEVKAYENYHYPKVDPGNMTKDLIFLLGTNDITDTYIEKDIRKCTATKYAQGRGTWVDNDDLCCWWLRTPGCSSTAAAYVGTDGCSVDKGFSGSKLTCAVRPALWIDLGEK